MIDLDDMAHAARYNDALAEEIGMEGLLKRYQIDQDGLLYMQEQRALRMALIYEGRNPAKMSRSTPTPVQLTPAARRLLPNFGSAWIDGFLTGLLARHDSSHDIPGIDTGNAGCEMCGVNNRAGDSMMCTQCALDDLRRISGEIAERTGDQTSEWAADINAVLAALDPRPKED